MFYYELALLKSPLNNLTYKSEEEITIGTKVLVKLQNRKVLNEAVIIKQVEEPSFKCTNISEISNNYYDEIMMQTAHFVSQYYVCSLGEALSVYHPFSKEIEKQNDEIKFDSKIVLSTAQQKAKPPA